MSKLVCLISVVHRKMVQRAWCKYNIQSSKFARKSNWKFDWNKASLASWSWGRMCQNRYFIKSDTGGRRMEDKASWCLRIWRERAMWERWACVAPVMERLFFKARLQGLHMYRDVDMRHFIAKNSVTTTLYCIFQNIWLVRSTTEKIPPKTTLGLHHSLWKSL